MDAATILGGITASLTAAIAALWAELRRRPSREEVASLRLQLEQERAESTRLSEQLAASQSENQATLRQWKDEVRERYKDAQLFVRVHDARRLASSRPPAPAPPGNYSISTRKKT